MIRRMIFPGVNRHWGLKNIPRDGYLEAPPQGLGTNADDRRLVSGNQPESAMPRFSAAERKRAQRFPIQTVLRYRRVGGGEWRQGTMVNISESGVLFETDHRVWPNTAVEMRFNLGLGRPSAWAAQVVCQGLIARAITEPGSTRVKALAAKITKFHFVRPAAAVGA
jgi:hypothetical protein